AAHEADERAKLCASLEVCVARRDKTIEELERNLQAHRDTAKGLDDEKLELNQRVARLELDLASQRGGSADEIRALRHELVAQERLIGTLETELEAKQKAIDALQRQESDAGSPPADAAAAPA